MEPERDEPDQTQKKTVEKETNEQRQVKEPDP